MQSLFAYVNLFAERDPRTLLEQGKVNCLPKATARTLPTLSVGIFYTTANKADIYMHVPTYRDVSLGAAAAISIPWMKTRMDAVEHVQQMDANIQFDLYAMTSSLLLTMQFGPETMFEFDKGVNNYWKTFNPYQFPYLTVSKGIVPQGRCKRRQNNSIPS